MTARNTNPWLVLVLVCLAQFMVILDATAVNVALPTIQRGLHFSPANLQPAGRRRARARDPVHARRGPARCC